MKTVNEYLKDSVYLKIRPDMIETLINYALKGWKPGGFTTAILANDLMGAFGRADVDNRAYMFELCTFVYNEMPANCHGSYEAVYDWVEIGGLEGRKQKTEEKTNQLSKRNETVNQMADRLEQGPKRPADMF